MKNIRKTQWSLFPNSYQKSNNFKAITYEIPCSMEKILMNTIISTNKESNILLKNIRNYLFRIVN